MSGKVEINKSKAGCSFAIAVTPRASRAEITGVQDGALKVRVTAVPSENAANEACIKLLAKQLGLKKSGLEIITGEKSRKKVVLARNVSPAELEKSINALLEE